MSSTVIARRFVGSTRRSLQSIQIASKPQFTGAGPFIELPSFQAIGKSCNLLNITIPSSSFLNIKSGSLVAIDGDLDQMVSCGKSLAPSVNYNQLYTQSPVSIIINGNSHYSIIDIDDKLESWQIVDPSNIIAWSGFSLELVPTSILSKFSSVKSLGKGKLILQATNQLFQVLVEEGEHILLNPNSLVATNTSIGFISLKNRTLLPSFTWPKITLPSVPRTGIVGIIPGYIDQGIESIRKSIATSGISSSLDTVKKLLGEYVSSIGSGWDFIKLHLIDPLSRKPIYIKVQGPCKLLLNNTAPVSNGTMFTKQEIHDIFKK